MSYCRWSSLDFYCDVYVYESVHGGWVTHVAGGRRPAGALSDNFELLMAAGGDENHPAFKLYMEQHRLAGEWLDTADVLAIDHPEAGVAFHHGSPGECADNLERLRSEGFIVPNIAIKELRDEQAEIDGLEHEQNETSGNHVGNPRYGEGADDR